MPHPRNYAQTTPDKPAIIMATSGEVVTYRQLEDRANQLAHLFRRLGLRSGDHIGMMMENSRRFFEIVWAAQRSGLIYTPISTHLIEHEVDYILNNCGAKAFLFTAQFIKTASALREKGGAIKTFLLLGDGALDNFDLLETMVAEMPTTPIAAPLVYNYVTMLFGGTSIIMEQFEAENALRLIEEYKANYSQWAPIMFIRMLKKPTALRERYDVSSMRLALHGAAPCPIEIKKQMIDWWGPVIFEYYGASEGHGLTAITSEEWLTHKGSVGRAIYTAIRNHLYVVCVSA